MIHKHFNGLLLVMAKKKGLYGVNDYVKKSRKKINRHKKRLNKRDTTYKKYRGQGR